MPDIEFAFVAENAGAEGGVLQVQNGLIDRISGDLPVAMPIAVVIRAWFRQDDMGKAHEFAAMVHGTDGELLDRATWTTGVIVPQPDIHDADRMPALFVISTGIAAREEGTIEIVLEVNGEPTGQRMKIRIRTTGPDLGL